MMVKRTTSKTLAVTTTSLATLLAASILATPSESRAESVTPQAPVPLTGKLPEIKMLDKTPGKNVGSNSSAPLTAIEQSLQLAVTAEPCDSVLSPAQCLAVLTERPEGQALEFNSISLLSWATALEDIDATIQRVVDQKTDMPRWQMFRGLAVQARHTVAKSAVSFEAAMKDPNPSAKRLLPKGLLDLNSKLQIRRVEVVHRIVITGDRMMIDQMLIDRTSAQPRQHRRVDQTPAIELIDVTTSLEAGIKSGLKNLNDSAEAFVLKVESEKIPAELPPNGREKNPAKSE